MTTIVDVARAYHFAATKHVHQRRKGQRAEPCMNHLTEVAELVAQGTGGDDLELILAAILHDVVEVTPTTLAKSRRNSGQPWRGSSRR